MDSRQLLQAENVLVSFSERLPTLKQVEQLLISEAMKRASGNQSIAAQILGVTRQALNKRLKHGG
jgi:DNA-binding protein Fis